MALQSAATKVIKMASVADKPVVRIELAADHPATVTRSENQYHVNAQPVFKTRQREVSDCVSWTLTMVSYPCSLMDGYWILV